MELAPRIKAIKASVSVERVLHLLGYLRRFGSKIACPFHSDSHPSAKVYPSGHLKCFACGGTWDVIDVASKILHCSKLTAIEWMENQFTPKLVQIKESEISAETRQQAVVVHRQFVNLVNTARKDKTHWAQIEAFVDYAYDVYDADVPKFLEPAKWYKWAKGVVLGILHMQERRSTLASAE